MSVRTLDTQGRWRSVTVAFRISPEENALLNTAVRLSGLTKQEYIIRRLQDHEISVQGNSRVYKALRQELEHVQSQLAQLSVGESVDNDSHACTGDGRSEAGTRTHAAPQDERSESP